MPERAERDDENDGIRTREATDRQNARHIISLTALETISVDHLDTFSSGTPAHSDRVSNLASKSFTPHHLSETPHSSTLLWQPPYQRRESNPLALECTRA